MRRRRKHNLKGMVSKPFKSAPVVSADNPVGAISGVAQGLYGGPDQNQATPTIDTSGTNAWLGTNNANANQAAQQSAMGMASQTAQGLGPSVADTTANQQMGQAAANSSALASSGSGSQGAGAARRQAMTTGATMANQVGSQASVNKAQEQLSGEALLGNEAGAARGQDTAAANTQAGLATAQGNLTEQQNQTNAQGAAFNAQQGSNLMSSIGGAASGAVSAIGSMFSGLDVAPNDAPPGEGGSELHLVEPGKAQGSHWILREEPDFLLAKNVKSGGLYKVPMVPLSPKEHAQAMKPHGAGPLGGPGQMPPGAEAGVQAMRNTKVAGDFNINMLNDMFRKPAQSAQSSGSSTEGQGNASNGNTSQPTEVTPALAMSGSTANGAGAGMVGGDVSLGQDSGWAPDQGSMPISSPKQRAAFDDRNSDIDSYASSNTPSDSDFYNTLRGSYTDQVAKDPGYESSIELGLNKLSYGGADSHDKYLAPTSYDAAGGPYDPDAGKTDDTVSAPPTTNKHGFGAADAFKILGAALGGWSNPQGAQQAQRAQRAQPQTKPASAQPQGAYQQDYEEAFGKPATGGDVALGSMEYGGTDPGDTAPKPAPPMREPVRQVASSTNTADRPPTTHEPSGFSASYNAFENARWRRGPKISGDETMTPQQAKTEQGQVAKEAEAHAKPAPDIAGPMDKAQATIDAAKSRYTAAKLMQEAAPAMDQLQYEKLQALRNIDRATEVPLLKPKRTYVDWGRADATGSGYLDSLGPVSVSKTGVPTISHMIKPDDVEGQKFAARKLYAQDAPLGAHFSARRSRQRSTKHAR
jgi:hypothetical protein